MDSINKSRIKKKTMLCITIKYTLLKKLQFTAGVTNLTGEDIRRYIGDDTKNFTSYFRRNPIWKVGVRYKF